MHDTAPRRTPRMAHAEHHALHTAPSPITDTATDNVSHCNFCYGVSVCEKRQQPPHRPRDQTTPHTTPSVYTSSGEATNVGQRRSCRSAKTGTPPLSCGRCRSAHVGPALLLLPRLGCRISSTQIPATHTGRQTAQQQVHSTHDKLHALWQADIYHW